VPHLLKLISCLHGTNVTIQPNKNNMATQQKEENILKLEDSDIEKRIVNNSVDAVIGNDDQNTPYKKVHSHDLEDISGLLQKELTFSAANESGDFEAGPRPAHESTPLKKEHQQTSSDETILKIVVWNCCKGLTMFVCLFSRVLRGRVTVFCRNYSHSHTVIYYRMLHVILISADTIARSFGFGPESTRGPIVATRHLVLSGPR
jgi:hypothetical protein